VYLPNRYILIGPGQVGGQAVGPAVENRHVDPFLVFVPGMHYAEGALLVDRLDWLAAQGVE
jgi:hypothetical protein